MNTMTIKPGVASLTLSTPAEIPGTLGVSTFSPNGVAINNNGDVAVAFGMGSTLMCIGGTIDQYGQITWGTTNKYDSGDVPSLSINDNGVVVEIHQTNSDVSYALWYNVGTIADGSISFPNGSQQAGHSGETPAISLNNQNAFVEVHETNAAASNLWWYAGNVVFENNLPVRLTFSNGTSSDFGHNPSVSLNDSNQFASVHWTGDTTPGEAQLYCDVGTIDPSALEITVNQNLEYNYCAGEYPAIAVQPGSTFAFEAHVTSAVASYALYSSSDTFSGTKVTFGTSTPEGQNGNVVSNAASNDWVVQVTLTGDSYGNPALWYSTFPVTSQSR